MRADRLLRLAEHLESGRLGHDRFDFTRVSEGSRKVNGCGTLGCAMGELPLLWPRDWEFYEFGLPPWKNFEARLRPSEEWRCAIDDAPPWFGICVEEAEWLFLPDLSPAPWNGTLVLNDDATAAEVAQGIRNFVAWKQAQQEAQEAVAVPEEELVSV